METIDEEEFIAKIETYDGSTLYVISEFCDHPVNKITYFELGKITIFEERRKLICFEGKINSLDSLNQETVWDTDYFKRLRLILSGQQKDCKYLFSAENDDSEEQKTFKVNVVLAAFSKAEVTWFKVKLNVNTTTKMFTYLIEKVQSTNEKQRKKNKNLEREMESERKQKLGLVNEIDKVLKMKNEMEQHCYEVVMQQREI